MLEARRLSENYATVNPCSMCMPMGSVMAFKGIEGCMPIFHGSQGCSTYMRLHLAHHFREPVDIASSALSEKGAVYGGAANLKKGLKNVIQGYGPRVIGIATTCLAETIGDDVVQIAREFQQEEPLARDVAIIPASTPSYSGSHEEGYNEALKSIVRTLAKRGRPNARFNLVIGSIISPAEVRHLKSMLVDWGCSYDYTVLPDISETFDAPLAVDYPKITEGGTPLAEIREMANSRETLTVGGSVWGGGAGDYLEREFGVHHTLLPLPIGVEQTDRFVGKLEEITDLGLPEKYERDRGRLLDAIVDCHKLVAGVRTAVYGDTDMVLGVAKLLCEMGMDPRVIATGSKNAEFVKRGEDLAPGSEVLSNVDFSDIHESVARNDIELLIGPFTGRQISKAEKIPLLRVGLPNHDRFGASRQMVLGYGGTTMLVDRIANAIVEMNELSR
jgi:nitrogenase molybdenum-iron protein NifN